MVLFRAHNIDTHKVHREFYTASCFVHIGRHPFITNFILDGVQHQPFFLPWIVARVFYVESWNLPPWDAAYVSYLSPMWGNLPLEKKAFLLTITYTGTMVKGPLV
jgi:hypothetical protein